MIGGYVALGDWQKRIYQIAQDFRPDSSVTSFEIRGTLSHDQAWVPDGAHGRS